MTESLIGADNWSTKVGTLAGCAVPDPDDIRRVVEVLDSDARDVLVLAPKHLFLVQPKSVKKLGLLSGLKAARGNTSGLGSVHRFERDSVRTFSLSEGPGIRLLGEAGQFYNATIEVADGSGSAREIIFLIDTTILGLGDIEVIAQGWIVSE